MYPLFQPFTLGLVCALLPCLQVIDKVVAAFEGAGFACQVRLEQPQQRASAAGLLTLCRLVWQAGVPIFVLHIRLLPSPSA